MKSDKNESNSKTTPTKAMCNLTELFELQSKRISIIEQQFLTLSARVSGIEGPNGQVRHSR